MRQRQAVGIDLGTTFSAVAWIDPSGHTAMVTNAEGELLTPSVVLFSDAEVVVGKDARSATTVHPDQVAEWVKRDMGAPVYSHPIRGEYLPPEVIQGCILRKLRADLVETLGPDVAVVITVPAYFDEPRRKATADAGEMAGLDVLDVVNEPTAAALAFGEVHGYLAPSGGANDEMTVLVYDLGGGTFDATLLRLRPGEIRTLATDGDVQLGGHDWDMRLLNHLADRFLHEHGLDPRDDAHALKRLYNETLDAKHALSARRRAAVRFNHAGHAWQTQITRDEFEDLTADLLERTAYTTRQLVAAAKLDWSRVSRVLLVGGSTRMPMVARMLREMTGLGPDHTVHPDEAVARGAALYARFLLAEREGAGAGFEVVNVNSHSLGVEGIDTSTGRKINAVLIPRNTPLPARCTEKFVTKRAGQTSIVVQVLEGESTLPGECTAIGRTAIAGLPDGLPQGWPIEVTFEYGTNGRLNVHALVPGTDREVALEIQRDVGLSEEGISRWSQPVADAAGFDAFEELVADVLGGPDRAGDLEGDLARREPPRDAPPDSAARPVPRPIAAPSRLSSRHSGSGPALSSSAPTPAGRGPTESPPAIASAQRAPAPPSPQAGPHDRAGQAQATGAAPSPKPAFQPLDEEDETDERALARWLINLIGFVVSAIVGLTVGYFLVKWFLPGSGIVNF